MLSISHNEPVYFHSTTEYFMDMSGDTIDNTTAALYSVVNNKESIAKAAYSNSVKREGKFFNDFGINNHELSELVTGLDKIATNLKVEIPNSEYLDRASLDKLEDSIQSEIDVVTKIVRSLLLMIESGGKTPRNWSSTLANFRKLSGGKDPTIKALEESINVATNNKLRKTLRGGVSVAFTPDFVRNRVTDAFDGKSFKPGKLTVNIKATNRKKPKPIEYSRAKITRERGSMDSISKELEKNGFGRTSELEYILFNIATLKTYSKDGADPTDEPDILELLRAYKFALFHSINTTGEMFKENSKAPIFFVNRGRVIYLSDILLDYVVDMDDTGTMNDAVRSSIKTADRSTLKETAIEKQRLARNKRRTKSFKATEGANQNEIMYNYLYGELYSTGLIHRRTEAMALVRHERGYKLS